MRVESLGGDDRWQVLESAPDAVVVCDGEGRLVFVNRQAEAMFGYDRSNLLGRPVEELIPERDRRVHRSHRRRYAREPAVRTMGQGIRLLARRADGSIFPAEISLSPGDLDGTVVVVASVRDVTEREALESQRETARAEARAAATLLAERERMAGELHDTVIQHLFSIGLGLQAVAATVPEAASARLLAAVDQLDDAIRELRLSIFRLKSRVVSSPISAELRSVVEDAAVLMGVEPRFQLSGPVDDFIDGELRVDLLNTFREAISNVVRHAEASTLDVSVSVRDGELRIVVTDDGVGLVRQRTGGNGLRNMGERAARHGGRLIIGHHQPTGTVVDWSVPLPS